METKFNISVYTHLIEKRLDWRDQTGIDIVSFDDDSVQLRIHYWYLGAIKTSAPVTIDKTYFITKYMTGKYEVVDNPISALIKNRRAIGGNHNRTRLLVGNVVYQLPSFGLPFLLGFAEGLAKTDNESLYLKSYHATVLSVDVNPRDTDLYDLPA